MKKTGICLLVMLLLLSVPTGCAKRGTTVSPSPAASAKVTASPLPSASPSVMPSGTPESSMVPETSASPEASPLPDDGKEDSTAAYDTEALQAEVEKLSEISTCVVAALGEKALVGVTFDPAYQGTLTSRIVEMVGQQITEKEPGITLVAVTADPKQFSEIESLAKAEDSSDKRVQFETLFQQLQPTGTNQTSK